MSSFSTRLVVLSIFDQGVCNAAGSFHRDERLTFTVFKDHLYHDLDVPNAEAVIVVIIGLRKRQNVFLIRFPMNIRALKAK